MIVSHLLLILNKKLQFYIFMFEAWNVAKGRKVQGGRILSQGTVDVQVRNLAGPLKDIQKLVPKPLLRCLQIKCYLSHVPNTSAVDLIVKRLLTSP